jgi:hypothetical protein
VEKVSWSGSGPVQPSQGSHVAVINGSGMLAAMGLLCMCILAVLV